jgi:hypothetical protein
MSDGDAIFSSHTLNHASVSEWLERRQAYQAPCVPRARKAVVGGGTMESGKNLLHLYRGEILGKSHKKN